jgi:hypothetical protein
MGMVMNIERTGRGRDLLLLGALSLLGFGLTMLAVWPTTRDQTAQATPPVRLDLANSSSGPAAYFGPIEHLTQADVSGLSEFPAPTLQELAADSDSGTRDEAQVLLALLGEEAAADQQL